MSTKFVGNSEDGEATVTVWLNAGDEVSLFVDEEYYKEGKPGPLLVEAMASLPRALAKTLGEHLVTLAEGPHYTGNTIGGSAEPEREAREGSGG